MTADTGLTGAPSHNQTVDWASLNWRKLEGNVRWLQARIVRAIQEFALEIPWSYRVPFNPTGRLKGSSRLR